MKVRVISVPHTGTRSTMKILRDAGLKPTQIHFTGKYITSQIYDRHEPAIIPIRDKGKVGESWAKRGKSGSEFNLDDYWEEMEQYIDEHDNVYLLHIDDPERRDDDLKAISQLVGMPLSADFSVKVGENGG